ncbi:MAG: aspartate aminotransferase family protein [Halobacteriovoraceae bacterium]|nr:aspartate aminotransferase family protein [Halobacteriovoraceae bacterium]
MTELSFEKVKELDHKYRYQNYNPFPVEFVKGENDVLFDESGKSYIDNLSGIAVMSLGHGNKDLAQLAYDQVMSVQHTSNLFFNKEQSLLSQALVEATFPSRVLYCSTGTEANEAAFKLMRAYGFSKNEKKQKIISLTNSFHGRTFGSMALTGQEKVQKGFGNMLEGIVNIPLNDLEALEKEFDENTCGIIMETLQGEGGLSVATPEFVKKARELATQYDALFAVDEIQSGIGRTGKLFHYEHYNVTPDIVTMAKGLGGGFPIGAIQVATAFENVFKPGMHGTTFGGNYLVCRIARHIIEVVNQEKFLQEVSEKAELYETLLNEIVNSQEKAIEVRGRGLMRGLKIDDSIVAREFAIKLLDKGVVIGVAGGNTLRFVPALTITKENIQKSIKAVGELLAEY